MGQRAGVILAAMLASAAAAAQAQEQTPPAAPAAGTPASPAKPQAERTLEGVTVTAAPAQGLHSDIDRKSYGIASDLATTTGSIGDALRNIPSVEVDPQGNVSLRGDSNVTILLDGKPSGQFKGASAAQALQALPADSIERVEVITNPSAEFSPDGAAGIINLISKKTRKPGASGSIRVNLGDLGRKSGGLTGSYNSAKLTVSADINGRYDPQSAHGLDARTVLDGQGHELSTSQTENRGGGHLDRWGAHVSADYDLNPKTRISGDLRFSHTDVDQSPRALFQGEDPAGDPIQAFDDQGRLKWGLGDREAQATVRRSFGGDDHTLTVNISRERIDDVRDQAFDLTTALPPSPAVFTDLRTQNAADGSELKADYVRPMPADGKLKAGYDLRVDDNRYDNIGRVGGSPADALPDPTQSNLFLYKQTVEAAYATYEQPFGDWTALAGLRLEDVDLDLNQVTTVQTHDTSYVRAYPSLHLAYKISDAQQLTLSYSKRVQRPNPEDLNPFPIQLGPLSFQAGNPNLQPQTTDSFEAGYQYRAGGAYYLATLYYRQNAHGVTDVITAQADGVLLTTKENLSDSKAAELELVANGHLTKTLSYGASMNLYWNEIDAVSDGLEQLLDFAGRRSAFEVGGRGSLTWQPTARDTFQATTTLNAKRLTPQGYIEPFALTYLGYRHKFRDDLFGVVTIQDPFEGLRFRQVTSTPILEDHSDQHIHIRGIFFGVTRTFGGGGKKPREPTFDFGGVPQP
ncbi:TonB-dependent receptor [Phenylobacterium sp.]|uniref:TonB-dependent receptor domain-containing protein n=1 Tax=Phenylobacterium sp. TaxID=1871053 RepID=UPI00120BBF84|nr:TonB-dependent receptor [Phenylobacterium sp.]THD60745.1 MAG: TonB-dependent receptor [Phenylobacterium sp.]